MKIIGNKSCWEKSYKLLKKEETILKEGVTWVSWSAGFSFETLQSPVVTESRETDCGSWSQFEAVQLLYVRAENEVSLVIVATNKKEEKRDTKRIQNAQDWREGCQAHMTMEHYKGDDMDVTGRTDVVHWSKSRQMPAKYAHSCGHSEETL